MLKLSTDIPMKTEDLGEFIKRERQKYAWRQKDLADRAKVNTRTVTNAETLSHVGQLYTLEAMLEALGYDLVITPKKGRQP